MATVQFETRGAVGIARLDRPDARNALSAELMEELATGVERWEDDPEIRCIVIAGNDDWFAAGADIKAMAERSFVDTLNAPAARFWPRLAAVRTPLIAAVSGYALGGGCELALLCDMIVASDSAEFGQPEILLGIIPGGGGTQRLARVLGKQRAMELVLTGRRISAQEAHELGLVNRVADAFEWFDAALELAQVVAGRPPLAVKMGKQAVLAAEETPSERRPRERAAALRARDGHRGPRGGHDRLHREAQARVPRAVSPAPRTVGVVGAGTMGAGIAQLGCAAGMRTLLHDPLPDALERGAEGVRGGLRRWVEKGRVGEDAAGLLEPVDRPRGAGALRAGDRGRPRAAGAQARAVRGPVRDLRRGGGAGHEHVLDPGDLPGRRRRRARRTWWECTSSTRRR